MKPTLDSQAENPKLSPFVRIFFCLASIIVLVGAGLYFIPERIVPRWLWPLTPFNANFLGAVYLAELASASLLIWYNRWAPARVALPMSYVFTGVVTIVTLFYLDRFDFQRWLSYFWFVLYIVSALVTALIHYVYRRLPITNTLALTERFRWYLFGYGIVHALYGLSLLIAPAVASGFWPWAIDDFHGRVYSALFLSAAAGSLFVARSTAALELRLVGLAQLATGLLPILGLVMVDASQNRVEWSAAGTWLWLLGFGTISVTGAIMIWKSLAASIHVASLQEKRSIS
ncbi:MAG TPA: hypothetical protein VJ821_13210 [Anaerolineales bacterium]|nr:hypothetical protein [Anaerolineales bacterium]